jgi:hypothetical protein
MKIFALFVVPVRRGRADAGTAVLTAFPQMVSAASRTGTNWSYLGSVAAAKTVAVQRANST